MIRSPAGFDGGDRIKRYLDYYQPSYGVMMLSAGQFSPASLFAAGEQGAWYDPSDLSTMFQDAAGTTPVTAVEQPVGLLLDKSKGLALGAELVTNGDFSNGTTGWTAPASTSLSVVSGQVKAEVISGADRAYFGQEVSVVSGKTYEVRFTTISDGTSKIARLWVGLFWSGVAITPASFGTHKVYWQATTTGNVVFWPYGEVGGVGTYTLCDNISVRELPGNHASQSTAASRPVLSARVNLLTYSEDFSNGVWNPRVGNATRTVNTLTPTTSNGSHYVGVQGVATTAGAQYVWSCSFKPNGYNYVGLYFYDTTTGNATSKSFRIDTGTIVSQVEPDAGITSTATISGPDVDGYYRCAITTAAVPGGSAIFDIRLYNNVPAASYAGDGVSGVYATKADLRVTNVGVGLPAYQRVAAATDYDTSGFPLYLKFDGTDDSLATGTIDPGAVDKAQVFAGVRKLSDTTATVGMLVEYSAAWDSNNGAFALAAPRFPNEVNSSRFSSRGTNNVSVDNDTFTTPSTRVLSGVSDIGGDYAGIRQNGTLVSSSTSDQGTGNYLSYPLYIGRRFNSYLPFNGQVYSMIVRFSAANLSDAQIASTETWVNGKTKAY